MEADYYVAWKLATTENRNSYQRFFEYFDEANFLTFNYDSLPEIFLSRKDRWFPEAAVWKTPSVYLPRLYLKRLVRCCHPRHGDESLA